MTDSYVVHLWKQFLGKPQSVSVIPQQLGLFKWPLVFKRKISLNFSSLKRRFVRCLRCRRKRGRFGEELTDILLYLVQLADHTGVDLGHAVDEFCAHRALGKMHPGIGNSIRRL